MNLRKRVERIEGQMNLLPREEADPLTIVDELLETPVDELVPGKPDLDPHTLRAYYGLVLAFLSYSRERPEFYTETDLEQWQARKRHAESLVEILDAQDPTSDVRAVAEVSKRVWLTGVRNSSQVRRRTVSRCSRHARDRRRDRRGRCTKVNGSRRMRRESWPRASE